MFRSTAWGPTPTANRFIQGDSLKQAIQRFHGQSSAAPPLGDSARNLQLRELLGRFVDVCQAVGYAHSRGVLHRDLKPDNVMLGKYGETLVVDWGLAKAQGTEMTDAGSALVPPSQHCSGTGLRPGSDIEPTQAGQVLRTLAYMSPEQAAGRIKELGPATDIYSLGATLYHLLTGRSPFAHWAKEVDFSARLGDVQHGRFPAPLTVGAVPAALNAICLRAMAVEPRARYDSLAALASDVEHWLADEPVAAFREPLTARAARWTRKHRAVVTGGVVTILVASLALVVVTWVTWQKNQDLELANTRERNAAERERLAAGRARLAAEGERFAADDARKQTKIARNASAAAQAERIAKEQQRKLAEESAAAARRQSELALATLNGVVFNLSRSLENYPGGGELRREILQTAITQLDQLAKQYLERALLDRATAAALSQLATVIVQINVARPANGGAGNELQDAIQTARRLQVAANETFQKLAAAAPSDPVSQRDLLVSCTRLGEVNMQAGDLEGARRTSVAWLLPGHWRRPTPKTPARRSNCRSP